VSFCGLRPLRFAALAAFLAAPATAQIPAIPIDAGHSYATLWMGRDTEISVMVNTGVAQVGGSVAFAEKELAASSMEFHLVPGGEGASLLAPDGALRSGVVANLVRYTVMSFRSTQARVRPDGLLQFTGKLTVVHVTRENVQQPWNIAYSGPTYADPETKTWTRLATFVLADPHAGDLEAALEKKQEIEITGTIKKSEFPELPDAVLDAYWPIVAEDEHCEPATGSPGSWGYRPGVCTGTAISVTPTFQRSQTTGLDFSGLRRYDAPVNGPVTIRLHLKLAPPGAANSTSPGD
jgi:polyisoprenoid-binding protein YceI